MDISFLPESPDNEHVEDCAFRIRGAKHISDDTTVLVSKMTTIGDGGLYRFVQVQNDGDSLSVVLSFDDNYGRGPAWYRDENLSVRRVKMSWLMVTDIDVHTKAVRNAVGRFTPALKSMIMLDEDMPPKDVWMKNSHALLKSDMMKELEGVVDHVVPVSESVEQKLGVSVIAIEGHRQQIEMHELKMRGIAEHMHRYNAR